MTQLYPIKFNPVLIEKVWGGERLKNKLNKKTELTNIGESWEISGIKDNVSVVQNGFLAGNNLLELVEVYMGDLVGESVFNKFGLEFPLLFKFIDANKPLSVQVHPDDEMAMQEHNSFGKNELWYIIDSDGGYLYNGFAREIDKIGMRKAIEDGEVEEVLNKEVVEKEDVFFIPAGRIHATGSGVLFAEIQQSSDITYRVFDWNRVGKDGEKRELHTDLAIKALDFSKQDKYKTEYNPELNKRVLLVESSFFTTNILHFNQELDINYHTVDSFVTYMCLEGEVDLLYKKDKFVHLKKGETVLIPAVLENILLKPKEKTKILETYINEPK